MAVPYTFGSATSSIPLSQLDSNFATAITLGNTAVYLGNTTTTLNGLTLSNVTISSGNVTITSVTLTNANITGTTTLSGLTASTALALDASKNIVSVTNTGTGNNVLAASPSLTGTVTIATLNLTNALGTAYGGTGLTSYTANGVLYASSTSALTTGSALTFDGSQFKAMVSGNTPIVNETTGGTSNYLQLKNTGGSAYIGSVSNDMAFYTSGAATEQMRLTSTGLGIGTSSPAYKLSVASTAVTAGYFTSSAAATTLTIDNTNANAWGSNIAIATQGTTAGYFGTIGSLLGTTSQDLAVYATAGNGFRVYTNGNNFRATIDSSGNLGLGVTPSAWGAGKSIEVGGSGNSLWYVGANDFRLMANAYYNGTNYIYGASQPASYLRQASGAFQFYNAASGTAGNAVTFTQAMSLTADGYLLVGTTAVPATGVGGTLISSGTGAQPAIKTSQGSYTGGATVVSFINGNGQIGSISTSGSATAYNTSSDYRLKNITGSITTSGAYIDSLNPVEGTWKADGSTFVGLIAHEVQEASRTQVATGTKDGAEMQSMDYSNSELIANLIAEVKSLRQRVATLEAK